MGGVTSPHENEANHQRSCIRWWRLLSGAMLAATLALGLVLTLVGQAHFLFAPVAYMPHVFVGPVLMAWALPGWWWGRRLGALLLLTGLVFHFCLLGWKLPPSMVKPVQNLRVAFVNRGDQDQGAWEKWIVKQQPDLIGLTDVRGKDGAGLGVGLPVVAGLPYLMRVGEHVLASRYPFKGTQVIRPEATPGAAGRVQYLPAARFEVDVPGGPIAVYVVHLRSPRDALSKYRSPKMWKWTLFGVPAHVSPTITIDHYWKEQAVVLEGILKRIEAETLPVLVLGDWNLPDFGPRYRRLTRSLLDAHLEGGSGFGHTFPGDMSHWAAFGLPWMRIDYVLTDRRHWRVEECQVQSAEEAAKSQHRALFVRLWMKP